MKEIIKYSLSAYKVLSKSSLEQSIVNGYGSEY